MATLRLSELFESSTCCIEDREQSVIFSEKINEVLLCSHSVSLFLRKVESNYGHSTIPTQMLESEIEESVLNELVRVQILIPS